MKTIGEILDLSSSFLQDRNAHRPRRSAEEILSFVLKLKKIDLYLQFDCPVTEGELVIYRKLLKKYASGEPLEYTIGEIDFFGCPIKIDRRALIPRPETEILVDLVAKRIKSGKVWDLCTGSGCIGLSLKKALPELQVSLSDLSKEALALAAENAQGMEVEILQGDLLKPFQGRKADFIICNPPYISEKEFLNLDPSVRNFEPKQALLGGERGTEFYERLERELPAFLEPGGRVFLEIGSTQGEAVKQIFSNSSWTSLELLKDWAGHTRFFFLEKQ